MKKYALATTFLIMGLILLIVLQCHILNEFFTKFTEAISSTLLVAGLVSLCLKALEEKEQDQKLRKMLNIHDSISISGFSSYHADCAHFHYSDLIKNSSSLFIVMNDGLRWVGNHAVHLKNRFSDNTTTCFYLVDPESNFINVQAKKTNISADELRKKIKDSTERIIGEYKKSLKKGHLVIYYMDTYPTRSIFLGDSYLVETPYQTSKGRATIPVFIFDKTDCDSVYEFTKADLDNLKQESKVGYDSDFDHT